MVIFHSYISLPEGKIAVLWTQCFEVKAGSSVAGTSWYILMQDLP